MLRCLNPRCQKMNPDGSTQCSNLMCRCLLPEAIVAGRYRIETLSVVTVTPVDSAYILRELQYILAA